jgi:sulfite reductase (ferredoxin)
VGAGLSRTPEPQERSKRDTDGLLVKQRIIDIYQHTGFDGIDPGDLRGRFRWYGLYTQRAQGIPGGRTAILEPEELEDEYFMLRVRIDGGPVDLGPAPNDRRHRH